MLKIDVVGKLDNAKIQKKITKFIKQRIQFFVNKFPNNIKIITSIFNPMLDENLLKRGLAYSVKNNINLTTINSLQGTTFLKIKNKIAINNSFISSLDLNSESTYDFSISKTNRIYIFTKLLEEFRDLHKMKIKDFINIIERKKYQNLILTYFNNKKLSKIARCPNCKSKNTEYIKNIIVPNVIGFLKNKNLYKNCLNCNYIFLEKQVDEKNLNIYYKNYTYPILNTKELTNIAKNPTENNVHHLLNFKNIEYIFKTKKKLNLLDLGSGDCGFAFYIKKKFDHNVKVCDFNLNKKIIPILKKKKILFEEGNILELLKNEQKKGAKYNIITLWETIEHLKISKLKEIIKIANTLLVKNGKVIISTPDYSNLICKLFDFWSVFPGEHLSVFSKEFLIKFFKKFSFKLQKAEYATVSFKFKSGWFKYYEKNKYQSVSTFASLLKILSKTKQLHTQLKHIFKKNNLGSEIIMIFRKTN